MNFLKCIKNFLFALAFGMFFLIPASAQEKSDSFFLLVETGSVKDIKSFLNKNTQFVNSTRGAEKESVLMAALRFNREYEIIELLLKAGADSKYKNKDGRTPVMFAAAYSSSSKTVEKIIKSTGFFSSSRRKKILEKDNSGLNALDYARLNKSSEKEAITELLEKYAKIKKENENTDTVNENSSGTEVIPAQEADSGLSENAFAQSEFSSPTENTETDESDFQTEYTPSPMTETSEQEDTAATEKVSMPQENSSPDENSLAQGKTPEIEILPVTKTPPSKSDSSVHSPASDTSKRSSESRNLLDFVVLENEIDPVVKSENYFKRQTLIENPDRLDINGRTLLMNCARSGDIEVIEQLLESGANVNLKDRDGWTALMYAVRFCDNEKVTDILIENGADVCAKNNYGITPLKLAAGFNKNPLVVKEILYSKKITQSDIISSFIYALKAESSPEILELFIKRGININSSYDGKTPLMHAAQYNKSTSTILWLLEKGAKITYKTSEGFTAFDFAKENRELPRDSVFWQLNTNPELNP